jgi:hypothetical protein
VGSLSLSLLVGFVGAMTRNDRTATTTAAIPAPASTSASPSRTSSKPSVGVPAPVQVDAPTSPVVTNSHAS